MVAANSVASQLRLTRLTRGLEPRSQVTGRWAVVARAVTGTASRSRSDPPVLTSRQQRFLDALAAELLRRDPRGHALDRVEDPEALARQAAERAVDTAAAWVHHLGPMYDVEGVRHLLARNGVPVSRQAVSKRRGLLALPTGSGRVIYPAFQFSGAGPLPGLDAVLDALPAALASRWTVASWLVSPQVDLRGDSPVSLLTEGSAVAVLSAARSWARSLAA